MHVDQVLDLHLWICNLCQERFSINHLRLFLGGTSRDTCTCIYVYISRIKQAFASVRSCGDNLSIGEDWSPGLE